MESEFEPSTPKAMFYAGWVVSALPLLLFFAGAGYSFAHPEMVKEGMQKHGYPESTAIPILVTEVICALLYLIPQTSVLGAILLTGYLGGATATHVRVGEPFVMAVLVGVLVWLGLFLRDARIRALIPIRR